ncbi:MAG: hypothetical protein ACOY5F_06610 [Pseudomonadota bacterium]
MQRGFIRDNLERSLRDAFNAPQLRVLDLTGSRPAADLAREPWIPVKYGAMGPDDWAGIVPARVTYQRTPGTGAEILNLIVKVNPRQGLARTLIPWIVETRGIALDRPYWMYRSAAESDHTAPREQHIYALAKSTPALRRVLPRCYGMATNAQTGEHAVFLEDVEHAARLDASGATGDWPTDAVDAALSAAADWQKAFWNAGPAELPFAAPRLNTADMVADAPLWRGILDDARKRFPAIMTNDVWRRRHRLIDTMQTWHSVKDQIPSTLAHNDFNQRNVGLRPEILVLDWELAELNTAHRDIVEMLTFALPTSAGRERIDSHLERHRLALANAGITQGTDRDAWMEGFRCELKVEAINRIGLQFVFGAAFPLAYLERINATIEHLLDLYR